MSIRSLNGLSTNNVRSLNGLEGIGIENIIGGDAIAITTATGSRTINVDISKQSAVGGAFADTDLFLLETSSGVIKKITGANMKSGSFSSNWTRSGGNIFPTITGDTIVANDKIQINSLADATYLDTLLITNTNAGTDILTYKYQIKDNGSLDAKLNFKVDYSRGGGTSIDVFDITYDGFLQVKKRLDVANGFFANSGEEYNFLSTGGTLANTNFFSGTSPITYNSSTGAIGTTFTPSSTTNMSGKTFTDFTLFDECIGIKQKTKTDPITANSAGFIRMFAVNNTNFVNLCCPATLAGNFDMILPTITTTTTLLGETTTQNVSNKTFTTLTTFNNSLAVKTAAPNTNVSGAVRFFERQDTGGSHFTDLHTGGTTHTLTADRNVFLPDATGTIVLDSTNLWEQHGSNKITPKDTSLTAIDLPNNCSIRNEGDSNQFIKFSNTSSTNETIQLASNQVSIENILMYADNPAYYLRFQNGILESTFLNIDLPLNSKIRSASNSSNFIGMESGAIYINTNLDIIEGGSIRNDSDPTNDFISFRNNHLYINYAITEVIQGGKIANASNSSNDFIQFNNNELAINHNTITFKQGASIKNASNSLSGFSFESDKITFATPVKIISEYTFPFPDCYPLEVEGYYPAPDTTGSALYYQNIPSLGGRAIAINGSVNMGIYTEYGLYCHTGTEIWVASDRRIKKDIEKFNGGLDLLRQLEVKSYCYIDGKGKNTKYKEIGFIAQEVKQIYPKAITQNHEYIPNVYKKIESIWTDFEDKFKMKSNDLNNVVDVDYKFFCWNEGDKFETKITAIGNSDNTFTFKKKWDNVFCIGNKVNDFNVLDKQQLFVINFNATQQLDNIVKQQQEEINTLKSEVEILKDFMNELITSKSFADFKKKIS